MDTYVLCMYIHMYIPHYSSLCSLRSSCSIQHAPTSVSALSTMRTKYSMQSSRDSFRWSPADLTQTNECSFALAVSMPGKSAVPTQSSLALELSGSPRVDAGRLPVSAMYVSIPVFISSAQHHSTQEFLFYYEKYSPSPSCANP
jgi:hypothetical protein